MTRTLLLVAGPSGSGKSRLVRMANSATLTLDDCYFDQDHPGLPRSPFGIPDWDDVRAWDLALALDVLRQLLTEGVAQVPSYDISQSARVGTHVVDARENQLIVAEGIFATQTYLAAQAAGLSARAIWLDRPRSANFARRLLRDLREHRKPPSVLLRRGLALFREEPHLRANALAVGFEPMSMRRALALVRHLSGGA